MCPSFHLRYPNSIGKCRKVELISVNDNRYDCVADTFLFRPFDNEIEIVDLEAYPLAYAAVEGSKDRKGREEMLDFLTKRGKQFVEVSEVSHKLYEGLTYGSTREEVTNHSIKPPCLCLQCVIRLTRQLSLTFHLPTNRTLH
jgi:hypothetical protein